MPPFTFRLEVSGLCAFVFDQPLKERPANGGPVAPLVDTECTVLLKRLIEPRLLSPVPGDRSKEPQFLEPHYPQLEFKLADLHANNQRIPDLENKGAGKGLCLLFGDDLTLRPGGQPAAPRSLTVPRVIPSDPDQPTADEKKSLWWMATMEDAFPGRGNLRNDLKQTPLGNSAEIVARLQITQGTLTTLKRSDKPCTFEPPGSPEFKQRVATRLVLEIPDIQQDHIAIRMVRNGRPEGTRDLLLFPSNGRTVEVALRNSEIDEFLGLPIRYETRSIADFEVHSALAEGHDPQQPAAFPIPRLPNGLGDTRHGGLCPPTALSRQA